MYRFVFRTSNFQDVCARAHARAYIIKRVTRFKWFRGFETSDCVRCPVGFYRVRATYTRDSITWQKYFVRCTHCSELLICCYYLRFVFATRVRALHSAFDECRTDVWCANEWIFPGDAIALRVNVYADYVYRSAINIGMVFACRRVVVWINMKFSINCAVFFEKFRNSSEMRQLNQMGAAAGVLFSSSKSLLVLSPSGFPSWDILFCKIPDIPAQSCPRF